MDAAMTPTTLREKLANGTLALGSWITIGHPAVAEIMAKAGFDWLVVDLEHSVISIDVAGDLIRTIDLCGVSPLVRLTSNNPDQIKRVLDAGAHGIVVPMVNSVAEATQAVAATRYGPGGVRGVGLARAQGYGANFKDYMDWMERGPIVIVQIEHKNAVEHLEEILSVRGIDGFIIGPYDLSCSMGIAGQFERQEFSQAMARIRETASRLRCPGGLHIVEPDLQLLGQTIREGFTFIAYSVDIRMLDVAVRQGVAKMQEAGR
jgi:2-keto-3-deoxy-L-rhamnonate aldolase RhmA